MYSKYDYKKSLNYDSYENPFRRMLTEIKNFKTNLPDSVYQKELLLRGEFNNEVAAGMAQDLTLINPDADKKLFKQIDYEPLEQDKVNFDDVNYKLDNRDKYDEGKAIINGAVDAVNDLNFKWETQIINWLKNFFGDSLADKLVKYLGIGLLVIILLKKI